MLGTERGGWQPERGVWQCHHAARLSMTRLAMTLQPTVFAVVDCNGHSEQEGLAVEGVFVDLDNNFGPYLGISKETYSPPSVESFSPYVSWL